MGFNPNPTADFMFTAVPVFMVLFFILFFIVIVFNIAKGVGRWNHNNAQPVLSVQARIVSKRSNVSSSMSGAGDDNGMSHSHTYTTYFITFEVESGSRMEFQVKDAEYGLLVEEDTGKLTFQGSRYLGFERNLAAG